MGKSHLPSPHSDTEYHHKIHKNFDDISKTIQKVLTLKMYFPHFYLCHKLPGCSIENLGLKCPCWNREKFLFQASNTAPQVPGLKWRKVPIISGWQLCAPSSWAEIGKSSYYFRVATLSFKLPGCKREKFLFQPRNSAPQVPRLK